MNRKHTIFYREWFKVHGPRKLPRQYEGCYSGVMNKPPAIQEKILNSLNEKVNLEINSTPPLPSSDGYLSGEPFETEMSLTQNDNQEKSPSLSFLGNLSEETYETELEQVLPLFFEGRNCDDLIAFDRATNKNTELKDAAPALSAMVVIEVDDKMKALVMRLNELPGLQRLLTRMKIHGVFINTASVDGKEPDEKLIALDGNHDTLRPPPLNPVFSLCNDTH